MDTVLGLLQDPKFLALIVPVLVAVLKNFGLDNLPSYFKPILAVVLGAALSVLSGGTLMVGATGGVMGIGVREIVDQLRNAGNTGKK